MFNISSNITEIKPKYNGGEYNVLISVDNDNHNNSFNIEIDGDFFIVNRDRNILNIHVNNNPTKKIRKGKIIAKHNCDKCIKVEIIIIQEANKYTLSVSTKNVILKNTYDKIDVLLDVTGGREEAIIKNVEQFCHKGIFNSIVNKEYDKGINIDIVDNVLKIESYGRIFVDADNYYVITLCHKDDISVEEKIKVTYMLKNYHIELENTKVNFTYEGITKDNILDINFITDDGEEFSDYGYNYVIEENTISNLSLETGPTSIKINCGINNTEIERKAKIKIYSIDDSNIYAYINVIQEAYLEHKLTSDINALEINYDDETIKTVRVKSYGGNRDLSYTSNEWIKVVDKQLYYISDFYKEYKISFKLTENKGLKRKGSILFKNSKGDELFLVIEQLSIDYKIDSIKHISIDNNIINVITKPANSELIVYSTGNWINYTINGNSIIINKNNDYSNVFDIDRKCILIVNNAEDLGTSLWYNITQYGSNSQNPNDFFIEYMQEKKSP